MREQEKHVGDEQAMPQAVPWRVLLPETAWCGYTTNLIAGAFCLLCYVIFLLALAMLLFRAHGWKFEWKPDNLGFAIAFFFLSIQVFLGPLFILCLDVICEIKHLCLNQPRRYAGQVLRDFFSSYIKQYLFNGALAYMAVYGVLISYTNLKPSIPLLNSRLYDDILFKWDSFLLNSLTLGGLFSLPQNPSLTHFLDASYFLLWPLACLTLLLSSREDLVFWRYTSAWCIAFGLSLPVSILFPTMGPAFFNPELFSHITGTHSASAMDALLTHYHSYKMNPLQTPIVSANGIVGMPSLHIALCYLSSLAITTLYPKLRFVMSGVILLFVVATVYLGWHYLLDGLGGLVVGWIAYRISCRWFKGANL